MTAKPPVTQDEPGEERSQRSVQSVEVGGRLLLALGQSAQPMLLKDLARAADLPPARAHPYLVSFSRLQLIEQDPVSGRYALGPAALQLGLTCLHQLDPVKVANGVAEDLARRTGYAVALAVWGNFGPTVIRMIDARQPLHVDMRAGTVMSLYGTATGRAFAAAMPPDRLQASSAHRLGEQQESIAFSARDPAADVAALLAEVRRHGVSRAAGRPIPGVNAFSAAACNHEGVPVIVITALGHQDHFPAQWNSQAAQAVRQAAQEISSRLGWRAG